MINATKGPRQDAVPELWEWGTMTLSKVISKASQTRAYVSLQRDAQTKCPKVGAAGAVNAKGLGGK